MLADLFASDIGLTIWAGLAVLGSVLGLLRWLAGRLIANTLQRIDDAVAQMDKVVQRVNAVEDRLERHLSELPLYYQRRDDAIREYTAINTKLDRLYELILRASREEGK